ncbi:MAG: YGGT family protein [Syntrophorhabdus sp. PtaU1.Bin050]|jgi:YggT family protein|nr:MAG: YGGT family protein [Syntrophorhabdus sp. PtaU1.Bin050]
MFVFGNLFSGIAYVLDIVLNVYFWVILARAILSWIRPDPYNPIVRIICGLVDPVTYRISKIIPTRIGMIDVAPFLLMLLIIFLQRFLVRSLFDLGARIQLP